MVESKTTTVGPPTAGDRFEGTPYRTIRRKRGGGQGEVFVVEHRGTRRELVAKLLHPHLTHDERLLQRLRIEAQGLGLLDHAHIVRIVGFEKTRDGRPFIVMEHLTGRTLAEELAARTRLPVLEAVTYASQLLSALAAAHDHGLVHRDIKPDNLFICEQPDGSKFLKVLDFGLARVLPGRSSIAPLPLSLRTHTGVVVGTPSFVSPEAAVGVRVDGRADIYAAGLVLYAMLAGRGPFDHVRGDSAETAQAFLEAHASQEPLPPSQLAPDPIPPELDRAILKALAKDPRARFQTATDFKHLLDEALELLRRPSGWLQTTAFSAAGFEQNAAPANEVPGEGVQRAKPDVHAPHPERADPVPAQPGPDATPHALAPPSAEPEPYADGPDSLELALQRTVAMPVWLMVLVFLLGVVVFGFATLGGVALLRGN